MVLVTGATGFIGRNLVERLCAQGQRVRCLVRRAPSPPLPAAAELAEGDLAAGSGLDAALAGVNKVIHLAGVTKALSAEGYYYANRQATVNLAAALSGRAVRLVHVSSLGATGPSLDGKPVTEETEPHPVSIYGRSKLEGEQMARQLHPETVVIRPPVVYGPHDTGVLQILKSVSRGWALQIGGCERWFSAIYVGDLVDGLMAAAFQPEVIPGRIYFMTHTQPLSWGGLAAMAAQIMGVKARTITVPLVAAGAVGMVADLCALVTRKAGVISRDKIAEARCANWTCDAGRAARELSWEAGTPHMAALGATLEWYKEAGWLHY
jgi:nucleoside-diphosphate-sugar epimerase